MICNLYDLHDVWKRSHVRRIVLSIWRRQTGWHHHDQEEADGGTPTGRQGKVSSTTVVSQSGCRRADNKSMGYRPLRRSEKSANQTGSHHIISQSANRNIRQKW